MEPIAIESVPERHRTEQRDEAAAEINQWAQDEWPISPSDMADRGEYSRQHYRNVLQLYDAERQPADQRITVPEGVEMSSYLKGYSDALDA